MSDPLTGTGAVLGGGLLGSVLYGVFTHTDFGVVFGAFGGAVFYVATAANLTALFSAMTPETYSAAFETLAAQDEKQWLTDRDDCRLLVHKLSNLTKSASGHASEAAFSTV